MVLAAYWLARAPHGHAPLGGWPPYLRPEQVGAPGLDSYWAADACRPTLSPAQTAAWAARLQRAAAQDPLLQGDWRPTPPTLAPQESGAEEPSPRDLALVAAAVPALLAAVLTDQESPTGCGERRQHLPAGWDPPPAPPPPASNRRPRPLTSPGGAQPGRAIPLQPASNRRPRPLTSPLPPRVVALPKRTNPMPKATPSALPTSPAPPLRPRPARGIASGP